MWDFTRVLEFLRDIVNAPTYNIVILFGSLFILLSFCCFDGITNFSLMTSPNWIMLIIGLTLTLGGLVSYVGLNMATGGRSRRFKMAKIKEGLKLKLGRTIVNLKIGKIQDKMGLDSDTAVVLPVNNTFIDDCIRDRNSATGAYILEFYPDRVSELPRIMGEQLEKLGYKKAENGTYAPGTTILLPPPYDSPAKILMTASATRKEKVGIRTEPSFICECIRKIFEFTSDKKISKLRTPILGSGHGGLDINEALLLLILTIKHYSTHIYHHIKQVDIIIRSEDAAKLKEVYIQPILSSEEINK